MSPVQSDCLVLGVLLAVLAVQLRLVVSLHRSWHDRDVEPVVLVLAHPDDLPPALPGVEAESRRGLLALEAYLAAQQGSVT